MEIRLIRSWATPSTLHLRVMISGRENKWHTFRDLHLAIADLDESVISTFLEVDQAHSPHPEDPTLPYTG